MKNDVTKAMILAAGEGTRLRPLTLEVPKVLLPVGGMPLIYHTINWLKGYGISQVAINLYHKGDKIKEFLCDGSRFGVKIFYSQEEVLLGTAGGVKRMEKFFDSTFLVVYGDNLTNLNLHAMTDFHRQKKAMATLALFQASDPREAGIVRLDEDARVIDFVEKPQQEANPKALANGGVYVFERQMLSYISAESFCDFAYDVFPKLIKAHLPIYGYILDSPYYIIDIGTPEKYRRANIDMSAGRIVYG